MKINTHMIIRHLVYIIFLAQLVSCASRQDLIYFQDELAGAQESVIVNHELRYKADDQLTIDVSALDPEVVKPFNLALISTNADLTQAQGALKVQTYIIDREGNINFPVLGKLNMAGLTRTEATEMLQEKLTEYIKDPIVTIRITNFTIMVIGEVSHPGTFNIPDERVTLIEAIGLAGDLTIYGKRDNVFLIRENNGEKKYAKIDLTSIKTLHSPIYYLEQNDVLYVEPNNIRIRQSTFSNNTAIFISAAVSTLATISAALILR